MKRLIISLILLLAIACVYIVEIIMLNGVFAPITNGIDEATQLIKNERYEDASLISERIEKQWQNSENKLSLFINHDIISEIGLNISKLPALATNETADEFQAECNTVMVMIIHIKNNEYPSISNIL